MDLAPVQQLMEVLGIPALVGAAVHYIQSAGKHRASQTEETRREREAMQQLLTELVGRVGIIDDWRAKHERENRRDFRKIHKRLNRAQGQPQPQHRDSRFLQSWQRAS